MDIWAFCPFCKDRVMNKREGGVLICEHGHAHVNGYPPDGLYPDDKKKQAITTSDPSSFINKQKRSPLRMINLA